MDSPFIKKRVEHHVLGYDKQHERAMENAEKMQADTIAEQTRNANVLRDKWVILRFFCYSCHKPHYWGGAQKDVGVIDYKMFCKKILNYRDYKNILLDRKFMDVSMEDAMVYSR